MHLHEFLNLQALDDDDIQSESNHNKESSVYRGSTTPSEIDTLEELARVSRRAKHLERQLKECKRQNSIMKTQLKNLKLKRQKVLFLFKLSHPQIYQRINSAFSFELEILSSLKLSEIM